VSGDVTPAAIVPKLEAAFGAWTAAGDVAERRPPRTPQRAAARTRIVFVDRPGAQSQLQVVRAGVPCSRKDRDEIVVMIAMFGAVSAVTSAVAEIVVHGLALDEYEKRPARIDAIAAADVKRVAGELLTRDTMTVVVVGDKKTVGPQLESLGLGDYEERDPYGN